MVLEELLEELLPAAGPDPMTSAEVARVFRVTPEEVSRWAKWGRIPGAFQTPGRGVRPGDWRYPRRSVRAAFAAANIELGR
jgi:Helix-turn-helix domain